MCQGAIDTVVVGLLTYMNWQDLPVYLKHYLELLHTVREHVEACKREFFEPDYPLDINEEIECVTKTY